MYVAGRGNVGNSATQLHINEELIRLAKVAVIARGYLTGLFLVWFLICWFRVYDMKRRLLGLICF